MDTAKLTTGQATAGVGGVLLVISLFLTWQSGSFGGAANAFDAFSTMDILMLLVGLAAIGYAAAFLVEGAPVISPRVPWILSIAAVVMFGWALGWDLETPQAGVGAWLGLIGSAAIAYGTYMAGSGVPLELDWTRRAGAGPRTSSAGSRGTARARSTAAGTSSTAGAGAVTPTTPREEGGGSPPARGGSPPARGGVPPAGPHEPGSPGVQRPAGADRPQFPDPPPA